MNTFGYPEKSQRLRCSLKPNLPWDIFNFNYHWVKTQSMKLVRYTKEGAM